MGGGESSNPSSTIGRMDEGTVIGTVEIVTSDATPMGRNGSNGFSMGVEKSGVGVARGSIYGPSFLLDG